MENLSLRDKFRVNLIFLVWMRFTRIKEQQYNYVAEKLLYLVDLNSSVEQLCDAVTAIIQEYPDDVDMKLLSELEHFHVYVKQNYPKDENASHNVSILNNLQSRFFKCRKHFMIISMLVGSKLLKRKIFYS